MKLTKTYHLKIQKGFSIVELMIAILIGIIILTGLITVFDTSSRMNRTQNGLARIQENGRYVISLMKEQISQTGFSYCLAEDELTIGSIATAPTKLAWDIVTTGTFIQGVPLESVGGALGFDPAYLLHGSDCTGGTCTPSLTSPGSDLSVTIPTMGVGDGDRIEGTDVLTIRYLEGGREVQSVAGNIVTFTPWASSGTSSVLPSTGQVVIMSCSESAVPWVGDISSNGPNTMTVVQNLPTSSKLIRAFNLQRDFKTITYYVANNVVDGRSIPTLYSVFNGSVNPIIEGVDAFDVVYGVRDNTNSMRFLDAAEVDAMDPSLCWPAPRLKASNGSINPLTNQAGCGWRSVTSIEIHLLLNTIYNSSNFDTEGNEPFFYSMIGSGELNQNDLPSEIDHYSMHRKEFYTTIALKNIIH